ncbi:hypothetical protein QFZ66_007950 [Streptomyces sp. B4I13]|uniref:hypothetical protein n=1 Tax=Streptomyces sp. B4I13 TaxID=3042271 RepID=UPI0027871AC6|nr:hypothetical protein [Streptomyces sp. B4I13]MDQ0964072.1 hypothetical protein [Streptomyces sp. B4I13]
MTTDSAADALACTGLAHALGALPGTPAHPAADRGAPGGHRARHRPGLLAAGPAGSLILSGT